MRSVADIYEALCGLAPLSLQMDFDNSGLQVGRRAAPVQRVLLSLDLTESVLQEALDWGAQLIVTHHPLLFSPLRSLGDDGPGGKALRLAEAGIALISMHTNLDIAQGGVNDVLMELLGAQVLTPLDPDGCGRVGLLEDEMPLERFLALVKDRLGVGALRYVDAGRPVRRLAVMGGSGGSALEQALLLDCDTYVTADIKYHQFLEAAERGLNLIDADHFYTEQPVIPALRNWLQQRFPELELRISQRHHGLISFF